MKKCKCRKIFWSPMGAPLCGECLRRELYGAPAGERKEAYAK
tara:strand:- start:412 stop:537 length:126 start_codon:yes stop_codon:yes gene_type:complete